MGFVQTALHSAQLEEESFITEQIGLLFDIKNRESSTTIKWEEVLRTLQDPVASKEWQSIGVAREEARYVFDLLDVENTKEVGYADFLGGCLRVNGSSKSIDLFTVMQEARKHSRHVSGRITELMQ